MPGGVWRLVAVALCATLAWADSYGYALHQVDLQEHTPRHPHIPGPTGSTPDLSDLPPAYGVTVLLTLHPFDAFCVQCTMEPSSNATSPHILRSCSSSMWVPPHSFRQVTLGAEAWAYDPALRPGPPCTFQPETDRMLFRTELGRDAADPADRTPLLDAMRSRAITLQVAPRYTLRLAFSKQGGSFRHRPSFQRFPDEVDTWRHRHPTGPVRELEIKPLEFNQSGSLDGYSEGFLTGVVWYGDASLRGTLNSACVVCALRTKRCTVSSDPGESFLAKGEDIAVHAVFWETALTPGRPRPLCRKRVGDPFASVESTTARCSRAVTLSGERGTFRITFGRILQILSPDAETPRPPHHGGDMWVQTGDEGDGSTSGESFASLALPGLALGVCIWCCLFVALRQGLLWSSSAGSTPASAQTQQGGGGGGDDVGSPSSSASTTPEEVELFPRGVAPRQTRRHGAGDTEPAHPEAAPASAVPPPAEVHVRFDVADESPANPVALNALHQAPLGVGGAGVGVGVRGGGMERGSHGVAAVPPRHLSAMPIGYGEVSFAEPQHMVCPISLQMMRDPVWCGCRHRHVYERACLEAHVRKHRQCPMSREPMVLLDIVPNVSLHQEIEQYVAMNKALRNLRAPQAEGSTQWSDSPV